MIGVLRGADPDLRDEYVVVTAHLDHDGIGPAQQGDSIYNGAVDNAAGVAALLDQLLHYCCPPQLARVLRLG